ncbi:MAG: hypothetical protein ABIG94_02275 [Pseudomonadota bacterium]
MTMQDGNLINKEAIDNFYSYLCDEINAINGLAKKTHQKILLVIIIDALARVWSKIKKKQENNRERFISLINECTKWEDGNRASLPQLFSKLKGLCGCETKLIEEVETAFSSWEAGRRYTIKDDPFSDKLINLASCKLERNIIKSCSHINLLYIYRNHLVHEFRQPGLGMDLDETVPYYIEYVSKPGIKELSYPKSFFIELAKSSLNNFYYHLLK